MFTYLLTYLRTYWLHIRGFTVWFDGYGKVDQHLLRKDFTFYFVRCWVEIFITSLSCLYPSLMFSSLYGWGKNSHRSSASIRRCNLVLFSHCTCYRGLTGLSNKLHWTLSVRDRQAELLHYRAFSTIQSSSPADRCIVTLERLDDDWLTTGCVLWADPRSTTMLDRYP